MNPINSSRKWQLTVFTALVGTLALFTGFIDGNQWVTCQTLVMGLYGAVNVAQKKLTKEGV